MVFIFLWQYTYNVSDAGISVMIVFLYNFLKLISSLFNFDPIRVLLESCPRSLYQVQKAIGLRDNRLYTFVVCPKCHSVYDHAQCIRKVGGSSEVSKRCWYIKYPNHPRQGLRTECGKMLLESVKTRSGNQILRPRRIFCYRPLRDMIACFFQQKEFVYAIQLWRRRNIPHDILGDIYDGNVWKTFQWLDGTIFTDGRWLCSMLIGFNPIHT